jgi:DNA transformation protein
MLARVGVHTAADLQGVDAVAVYRQVKALWPAASLNLLYALVAAQEGGDWRAVARERRTELLMRLDDQARAAR